eukprot:9186246-Ditylum_brightwellii.AAC.1
MLTEDLKALVSQKISKTNEDSTPSINHRSFPAFANFNADIAKPTLPISFDTNLLHFEIPVGKDDDKIRLVASYNTCTFAKHFPHRVKSLVWAKEQFTPITLSGIMLPDDKQEVRDMLTTVLPAVIEYHIPIKTKSGQPTSLKIAIGEKVAVNTIIGMSVIKVAKLSLSLEDKVIDPGLFALPPFPVIFKQAGRLMPHLDTFDETKGA